jgi:DNA polymerase-3 subunit chi
LTRPAIRVDFYVLPGTEAGGRLRFTCRLSEKVYGLGQRAYAHMASAAEARQLDELLWTFRAGSFVPHELVNSRTADAGVPPVIIGAGDDFHSDQPSGDVLINLADQIPPFFDRFERIAEIIDGTAECRRLGRERFSFYRDNGYAPDTHDIA